MADFRVRFVGDLGNLTAFTSAIRASTSQAAQSLQAANMSVATGGMSVGGLGGAGSPYVGGSQRASIFPANLSTEIDQYNKTFRQAGQMVREYVAGWEMVQDKFGNFKARPITTQQVIGSYDKIEGDLVRWQAATQKLTGLDEEQARIRETSARETENALNRQATAIRGQAQVVSDATRAYKTARNEFKGVDAQVRAVKDWTKDPPVSGYTIGNKKGVFTESDAKKIAGEYEKTAANAKRDLEAANKEYDRLQARVPVIMEKASAKEASLLEGAALRYAPWLAEQQAALKAAPPIPTDLQNLYTRAPQIRQMLETRLGFGGGFAFNSEEYKRDIAGRNVQVEMSKDFQKNVTNFTISSKSLTGELENSGGAFDRHGKVVQRWGGLMRGASTQMGQTAKDFVKVIEWTVATTAVFGGIGLAVNAVTSVNQLNASMQRFGITAKVSGSEANSMFKELSKVAYDTATPLTELVSAADDIALATRRANQSTQQWHKDILSLTNAVGILTNIAQMDTVSATELLTASMKQMDLTTEQTVQLLNQVTAAAGGQANSITDIMTGLGAVTEAASEAGMTTTQQIAAIQVISQVTGKSAENTATAFKNLFGALNADSSVKELASFGIAVRDADGNVRDFLSIYKDIKDAITQGVIPEGRVEEVLRAISGGPRRAPDAAALVSNIYKVFDVEKIAASASNEALIANAKILDTNAAKLTQLRNVWETTAYERLANVIQDLTNAVVGLGQIFTSVFMAVPPQWISMAVQAAAFLAVITLIQKALGALTGSFAVERLVGGFTAITSSAKQTAAAATTAATATAAEVAAVKAVQAVANPTGIRVVETKNGPRYLGPDNKFMKKADAEALIAASQKGTSDATRTRLQQAWVSPQGATVGGIQVGTKSAQEGNVFNGGAITTRTNRPDQQLIGTSVLVPESARLVATTRPTRPLTQSVEISRFRTYEEANKNRNILLDMYPNNDYQVRKTAEDEFRLLQRRTRQITVDSMIDELRTNMISPGTIPMVRRERPAEPLPSGTPRPARPYGTAIEDLPQQRVLYDAEGRIAKIFDKSGPTLGNAIARSISNRTISADLGAALEKHSTAMGRGLAAGLGVAATGALMATGGGGGGGLMQAGQAAGMGLMMMGGAAIPLTGGLSIPVAGIGGALMLGSTIAQLVGFGNESDETKEKVADLEKQLYDLSTQAKNNQSDIRSLNASIDEAKNSLTLTSTGTAKYNDILRQYGELTYQAAEATKKQTDTYDQMFEVLDKLSKLDARGNVAAQWRTIANAIRAAGVTAKDQSENIKTLVNQLSQDLLTASGRAISTKFPLGGFDASKLNWGNIPQSPAQYPSVSQVGKPQIVYGAGSGAVGGGGYTLAPRSNIVYPTTPVGASSGAIGGGGYSIQNQVGFVSDLLDKLKNPENVIPMIGQLGKTANFELNGQQGLMNVEYYRGALQTLLDEHKISVPVFEQATTELHNYLVTMQAGIPLMQEQAEIYSKQIEAQEMLGLLSGKELNIAQGRAAAAQALASSMPGLAQYNPERANERGFSSGTDMEKVANLLKALVTGAPVNLKKDDALDIARTIFSALPGQGAPNLYQQYMNMGSSGQQAFEGAASNMFSQGFNLEVSGLTDASAAVKQMAVDMEAFNKQLESANQTLSKSLGDKLLNLQARLQGGEFKGHMDIYSQLKSQADAEVDAQKKLNDLTSNMGDNAPRAVEILNAALASSVNGFQGVGKTIDDLMPAMFNWIETLGLNASQIGEVMIALANASRIAAEIANAPAWANNARAGMQWLANEYADLQGWVDKIKGIGKQGGGTSYGQFPSAAKATPAAGTLYLPEPELRNANIDATAFAKDVYSDALKLQAQIPGEAKRNKDAIVVIFDDLKKVLQTKGVSEELLRKALDMNTAELKKLNETRADMISRIRVQNGSFAALASVPINSNSGISVGSAKGPITINLNINGQVLTPATSEVFASQTAAKLGQYLLSNGGV